MKQFKYYIIPACLAVLFFMFSCTDTYELHEKYIADGETIYSNKVDSLVTLPGKNRLEIQGYISNAFNVMDIIVYWNNGENSQIFPYAKSENDIDKLELIVTNLEEGTYQFDVYSRDQNENKSVMVTTFGTSYGDLFESNLVSRAINTFALGADLNANVNLKASSDYTRRTEFKFTNLSGVEIELAVAEDEMNLVLEQVDITAPISYRTYYVPSVKDEDGNETSIDEFPSNWDVVILPSISSILDGVMTEPIAGGVNVTWDNPTNEKIKFDFEFSVGGNPVMTSVESEETNGSAIVSGMELGEQELLISISDLYGNSFGPISKIVSPAEAVQLNKALWSIVDFSSEEPKESTWGPPIQGSATALIDDDFGTFWHTAWDSSQPEFPHYFTIDLGATKTIVSFEIFRRQNKTDAANLHEFWISDDNATWTKVATYIGALESNAGKLITADGVVTARYVKYVAVQGPNFYTHLAEINIFGVE